MNFNNNNNINNNSINSTGKSIVYEEENMNMMNEIPIDEMNQTQLNNINNMNNFNNMNQNQQQITIIQQMITYIKNLDVRLSIIEDKMTKYNARLQQQLKLMETLRNDIDKQFQFVPTSYYSNDMIMNSYINQDNMNTMNMNQLMNNEINQNMQNNMNKFNGGIIQQNQHSTSSQFQNDNGLPSVSK